MQEELYEQLRALQKKTRLGMCVLLGSIALTVVLGLTLGAAAIAGFALLIVSAILTAKWNKAYTTFFKENLVRSVLSEVFTDMTFTPSAGIAESVVYGTGMVRQGDIFSSNDLITGTYNGVAFSQSDVHIEEESTDSEGHTTTTTLFRGRWMIFEFNKEFRCELQVVSRWFSASRRKGLFARKENRMQRLEFENEQFNKEFHVYGQNQEEAFYLLTPHMMESLLRLRQGMKAPVMLMFVGGVLHIAVQNNKDAFEANVFGKCDPERDRARILADTRVITDFVDEMNLDRDIYK